MKLESSSVSDEDGQSITKDNRQSRISHQNMIVIHSVVLDCQELAGSPPECSKSRPRAAQASVLSAFRPL